MESKQKEIILQKWLLSLEKDSTDKTPFKLASSVQVFGQTEIEKVLTTSYLGTMKRRGSASELDSTTKSRIGKVAKWLVKRDHPGLILYGLCGTGKTTMLKAMREIMKEGRNSDQTVYLTASDVYSFLRDDNLRYKFDQLKSVPVLLIDDVGCEPEKCMVYGTLCEPIRDIIYSRYEKMLTTVLTTNLDDPQIKNRYGVRVSDRLAELYDRVTFKGESYRIKY